MKIKSFLAFEVSKEMRKNLHSMATLLSTKVDCIHWVPPSSMHCTLRFFDNVDESLLSGKVSDTIQREVRHQKPFTLFGQGIGVFPNWRYPKILWSGLQGDTEAVMSLHAKLEEAFEAFGFKYDPRQFRLHLTLGRAKSKFKDPNTLMQLVEKLSERDYGSVLVNELVLYQIHLDEQEPRYTELNRFQLGK